MKGKTGDNLVKLLELRLELRGHRGERGVNGGPNGDLFKKRQGLVKPIQDDVFNAVQEISNEGSYSIVFDKAGGTTLFFTNPKFDLSDQVLQKLGYK